MRIARPSSPPRLISLVSMIDVLLIMLVFFMVTSTYLDLRMMPMVEQANDPELSTNSQAAPGSTVLIRLSADGTVRNQGRVLDRDALQAFLSDQLIIAPATSVVVLPSGNASTQSLVALLDTATMAGVTRLRVLQLEARP